MPESGGTTTQSGIYYQNSIAALFLGKMCDQSLRPDDETIVKLRCETIDAVDDIVITYQDDHKLYIQAKENIKKNDDNWKKLWKNIYTQYSNKEFQRNFDRIGLWFGSYSDWSDALKEICERAKNSENANEWNNRINRNQKLNEIISAIEPYLENQLLSKKDLFHFFSNIEIEICPFNSIIPDKVQNYIPNSNIKNRLIFKLLRDYVGGKARVRGTFTAKNILKLLNDDIPNLFFTIPTNLNELNNYLNSCSSILENIPIYFGKTQIHLEREITQEIIEWCISSSDDKKNVAMLLDHAGMGKSNVLHDILVSLKENGNLAVVGIKADQQLERANNLDDISTLLDIPYPIHQILGVLSKTKRVIVIIDQIDTLSKTFSNNSGALNTFIDFVSRIRKIPNIRIVLSCRNFDRESDPRLRDIANVSEFSLKVLSEPEIQKVLTQLDITYADLSINTRKLLSTPLHLNLFLLALSEIEQSERKSYYSISNIQQLYNQIWTHIVLRQTDSGPDQRNRQETIFYLAQKMYVKQISSVLKSTLMGSNIANIEKSLDWFVSERILLNDNGNISFLHQTFFDFCFALNFISKENSLSKFILNSQQDLFIRPLIIQILNHLRGSNSEQYLYEINCLVDSHLQIRHHLYDLILQWFGAISEPTQDEWIIAKILLSDEKRKLFFFHKIQNHPDWLKYLKVDFFQDWLSNKHSIETYYLPYLASIINYEPYQLEVIEYVIKNQDDDSNWFARIRWLFSIIRKWHSEEAVEYFEKLIYKTPEINHNEYHIISLFAPKYPEIAIRIIVHLLYQVSSHYLIDDEILQLSDSREKTIQVSISALKFSLSNFAENELDKTFHTVSKLEPGYYLDELLPWVLSILNFEEEVQITDNEISYPYDFFNGNWYDNYSKTLNCLIHSIINAFVELSQKDKQFFHKRISDLSTFESISPQRIILNVYRQIANEYSIEALHFLLNDNRRLNFGDLDYFDNRKFIESICNHLPPVELALLESHIMNYLPIETRLGLLGLQRSGIEQYALLYSFPSHLLSSNGKRRLTQWKNKFPQLVFSDKPITSESGFVQSPIHPESARYMTIAQWKRAITKYDGDYVHPDSFKGGASQLSSELEKLIIEYPEKFTELFSDLDVNINRNYITAIITGIATSTISDNIFFSFIRKHKSDNELIVRSRIASELGQRVTNKVPDDLISALNDYLNEELVETVFGEDVDLYTKFINCLPGKAFSTLLKIYDDNIEKQWALFDIAINHSNPIMKMGAIVELTPLIQEDRKKAIYYFKKLLQNNEILLNSDYTATFIRYAFPYNFLQMYPFINKLLSQEKKQIQETGAAIACLAHLSPEQMESFIAKIYANFLSTKIIRGEETWKYGAARVYSINIGEGYDKDCLQKLSVLLDQDDPKIHNIVCEKYFHLRNSNKKTYYKFTELFSKKCISYTHFFIDYLSETAVDDPEWTLTIFENFVTRQNLSSFFKEHSYTLGDLFRILIRIHGHFLVSEENKKRVIDLIDYLFYLYPLPTNKIFNQWDERNFE